jgi:hypothetical protein
LSNTRLYVEDINKLIIISILLYETTIKCTIQNLNNFKVLVFHGDNDNTILNLKCVFTIHNYQTKRTSEIGMYSYNTSVLSVRV